MLMGQGAEDFAKLQGLELVDNSYFHTERRRRQLQRVIDSNQAVAASEDSSDEFEVQKFSTVGAVALDQQGNITAGTSTGRYDQ